MDKPSPLESPWLFDPTLLADELDTDTGRGLTAEGSRARLTRYGRNVLDPKPPISAWRRLLGQFIDPLVFLLMAAVAISLVTWALEGASGVPFEALVIGAILIVNGALGYVQEQRAESAVAALQQMAAPHSTVIRDGIERSIDATDVVPGDILVLGEGDAVTADARLIEAVSLTVAEAALTGESEPVLKDGTTITGPVALGDRVNMVFSGTAVTRGRGKAIVTGTGMSTEIGRIADLLESTEEEPTPLQREIAFVGRTLAVAVVAIAIVIVGAIFLTSDIQDATDVVDVLLVGVSLAVAAVPEGLPAVLSVVLALGVQRMARKKAIVKNLSSVETLGSASIICSDKTGTLTRNEMTIRKIVTRSGEIDVSGEGYRPEGSFESGGHRIEAGPLRDEARAVLAIGTLANDASVREENGEWIAQGDPTEAAFVAAQLKAGLDDAIAKRFSRVGEVPFTSERKLMSTLQADAAFGGRIALVTKGAPDVLLARCTHEHVGEEPQPMSDERRKEILATIDSLAAQALRTLATAYRPLSDQPPARVDENLESELIFAGIVGIIDPPRAEAKEAIAEAHRAGIRVAMITGDHPLTATRIATELGVVEEGGRALTGLEIDTLDDEAFRAAVSEVSVYARVAPEHKLRIVDALQAHGNVVAMTGDGVNDAPALKSADIGVAMGITGTEVSKEAANMILADDNFATIVAAVREGRGIFSNIRKFLRYLLSSNVGEVLTMFFGVVAAGMIGLDDVGGGIAVPLLATQILWINLLTDAAPALAMGVDPPPDDLMERPPRRLTDRVIDREMWLGVIFVGAVMALVTLLVLDIRLPGGLVEGSGSLLEARAMAFTTLVLAQLFNCFNARSDQVSAFHHLFTNRFLWGAIGISLALQVAVIHLPFLNKAFDTTPLRFTDWVLCAALASTVLWADELRKLVTSRARRVSAGRT